MEAIPLSDGVGQDTRVRMTFVRMDLDVEVVGKHFLGIACCQEQLEDKEEKDTNDVLLADKFITACFLVSTEGGGTPFGDHRWRCARPPPSWCVR